VIVEYLDSLQAPALLAASGAARWDMLRWEALADGVLDAVVARLLESRRPEAQQSADNLRRQEDKITRSLEYIARRLGNAPWLVADRFTLADLVVAVALEYTDFRYPHDWRSRHPRLGQWLAGVSARPSFIETRPPGMEKK
jgi:glutathione S-transferase